MGVIMSGILRARSILAKGHPVGPSVAPPRTLARLFYSTALQSTIRIAAVSSLVATALLAVPALAQNTKGGNGGQGNSAPSPVGGSSSLTGTGGAGSGTGESYEGGAGGGAGAIGGKGGDASNGGSGGTGGAAPGASGGNGIGGGIGSRASGGGGGAHGAVLVSTSTPAVGVAGGFGGAGGDSADGDGGGGGAGGYGIVVDTGGSLVFNNAITGGNGGRGGNGYFYGGSGGYGGHGLAFTSGATATINAAVTGGNGGAAGAFVAGCCAAGDNGSGGTGIIGSNVNLFLNAVVSGGLAGDGVTRAPALRLGGSSRVTLGSGWGFSGGIVVDSGGEIDFAQPTNVTLGDTISGAGSISKSSAGTLTLTGANSYTGGTTITGGLINFSNGGNLGSGNITLNGGGLQWAAGNALDISSRLNTIGAGGSVFDTNGNNVTLAGGLSGGGLVKSGAGALILTGTNSYGATMISAGSLQIGNGSGSGTLGTGDVVNNGTLAFNRTGAVTVGNAISGSGNVIHAGTGTTILSGANSYSGTTTIQAGTLVAANASALGTTAGGTVVQSGASLRVQGGVAVAGDALTINGTGEADGGALRGGTGTNGYSGVITLGSSARINADGNLNITNAVIGGGNGLTVGGDGGVYFAAGINGISSLTKDGTGIAVMYGTNGYTGPTTVNAGTLQLDSGGAIGDDSTVVVNGAGILRVSTSETIGSLSGDGSVILQSGAILTTGGNNGSAIYSGIIVEQIGAGGLAKTGTGALTLTGTSSYTGVTTIDGGTLRIGNGGTSGTLGTGDIVNNAALVIDRSDTLALGNLISGSGTVTQSGSGTLRLTNAGNNYSGGTIIESGTVEAGAGDALGTGSIRFAGTGSLATAAGVSATIGGLTIDNGVTATIGAAAGQTLALTGNMSMATAAGTSLHFGSASQTGTILLDLSSMGMTPNSGSISIDGGTLRQASSLSSLFFSNLSGGMTIASGASYDLNGFSGSGVNLTGGGTIINNGASTAAFYADQSSISVFGGSIQDGTGAASLIVRGGGRLILTGTAGHTGGTSFSGNSTLQIGNGGTTGSIAGPIGLTPGAGLDFNRSNGLVVDGMLTGTGIVRQIGGGTTSLTGNNTSAQIFSGSVFVDAGRLDIDGDFGDMANKDARLVVGAAGTLGGSGTFFGNVDAQNGTLAPGNSPGTLTIAGDLTLGAGTILNFELGEAGTVGGPNNDLVNVGGNLILDGTLNTFASAPAYGPGYYRLFNYGGTLTDNGLLIGSITGGFTPTILTNIDGQVNLLLGDGSGQIVQYWDGADTTGGSAAANGNGGAGIWNTGGTNWTMPPGYAFNDRWQSQVGVFGGAAGGAVTIDGTQSFQELRFVTDGYTLAGSGGLATTGGFSVIEVDNGVDAEIAVTISGAGGLTKTGTGILTLGGANSYAGVTTVSEGILALSSTGSLAGTVMNGATFNNAGTVAGRVTNNATLVSTGILAGGLVNNGSASLQNRIEGDVSNLGGTITLTGATGGIARFDQLADATFDLAGFSTAIGALNGAGTVQLGGNAVSVLTVGDASSTLYAGTISGAGGLTKTGSGTLTLTGANGYSGVTTIDAGTLTLTSTGSLAGDVENNATFNNAGTVSGALRNSGALTSTGILAGGLVNSGSASLQNRVEGDVSNLAGTISLTGATGGIARFDQTAEARLDLAGFSTALGVLSGAGIVELGSNPGSALTVGDASSSLFAGTITGSGRLVKTGAGTLTLTGANSHSGGTLISAGALRLGDGGTAGSIIGPIEVNGALIVDRSDSYALTNALSGTGSLVQAGTGTTILSGANSLTGGFVVSNGRLRGDTAAFGANMISADGTIEFAQTAAGSYAGQISGGGVFEKTGAGRLTLTGTSAFAGQTRLLGGELSVSGSLAQSALAVAAGARLSGAGTVGTVTLENGAIIAPGNSIGTLRVNGDITFAAGSIYEVEVDPTGTATDLVAVTGRAILNGGSVVHIGLDGNYRPQATYTILTAAGGVEGTFAAISSRFAFLDPTLGYGANAVTLTLERNDIDFADVTVTPNQRSIATGVQGLGFANPVFDAILTLDADGARGAFDLLSGEIYASLQSALVQDSRFVRGAALDRMRDAGAATDAEPGLRFWMQGLGSRGHLGSDGNARRMKQDSAGFLLGIDAIADETVQLGAFGGYQRGDASVRATASDADIDTYHLGVYAGTDIGALGLRAGYAFSWHHADVTRRIAFTNFTDTVTADYGASTAQAFAEVGYRIDFGAVRMEPFAQIAQIWVDSERFGERGGAAALEGTRAKMSSSVSTLGARLDQGFSVGSLTAGLQVSAGWRHAFGDRLPVTINSFGRSTPFAIAGTPIARDAFAANIGIDLALSDRMRLGLAYSGDVARRAESHSGRASFSWAF